MILTESSTFTFQGAKMIPQLVTYHLISNSICFLSL